MSRIITTELDKKRSAGERLSAFLRALRRDLFRNRNIYFMAIPVIVFYILFHYMPMYGAVIAFKDFAPARGIVDSPWAGFKHFESFFQSFYFGRVVTNTLAINVMGLVFGFPAPILLALLLNEVRSRWFKRTVQTISYLPHFISIMVIAGLLIDFSSRDGLFNVLIVMFGGESSNLLTRPELFRPLYVGSDIWQGVGWGSIIYLAALSGIDPQLYEAARIDGAGRLRQTFHITLPGILPTIVILLVLRIGQMMNVGFEKIILLYNPNTYETADVISSYVYRKGLLEFSYSFSAAVGLFNSVINFLLLIFANKMSRMLNETSLW
jgi:putative aldouronate transport system permease protein